MSGRLLRRLIGALAVVAGLFVLLMQTARRWRRRTLARLTAASTIAHTTCGPIEYVRVGEGRPVLVLHGAPGGYDQGLAVAAALADRGYQVIAPSRPGYLQTPLAVGQTPVEQARAMIALLDALSIDQADLIAFSAGGPPALQLTLHDPQRISRLVLLAAITAASPFDANRLTGGWMATDIGAWLLVSFTRLFPQAVFPPEIVKDAQARKQAVAFISSLFPLGARRDGTLNDAEYANTLPPYPLDQISVPVLLIHGTADGHPPFADSEKAAAQVPDARLFEVVDGKHETTPFMPQVLDQIDAFLQDIDPERH